MFTRPVALLTTSFPLSSDSISAPFVKHLADHLSKQLPLEVLTPDDDKGSPYDYPLPYKLTTFAYAPKRLQVLSHRPGGIPAALSSRNKLLWLLIPCLLCSMFIATWRAAGRNRLILANWSVCGFIAGLAGKTRRCPVITVLRGEDANRGCRPGPFRWLLAGCLALSDRVVTVAPALSTVIHEAFPKYRHPIRVIPNGIDSEFFAVKPPQPRDKLHLIFVGGLTINKDAATALTALSHLPSNVILTIVGDGPERQALHHQCRDLCLQSRVYFLGARPPAQIPSLLGDADALVLASRREGRPNVVLEAMAAGRPVVATDLPGIREMLPLEATKLLFPPGSAKKMAESIRQLLDPEIVKQLSNINRAHAIASGLTWDKCARAYVDLIEEVCA